MCLAIPKQVASTNKGSIFLRVDGKTEAAGTIVKVKKGDWVLTQEDIIIKKIAPKQAREILKILNG